MPIPGTNFWMSLSRSIHYIILKIIQLLFKGDPLGVILLIDFYAIRSQEYKYLIEFYELFNPFKHLYLMPNMIFSIALAHFSLFNQTNNQEHLVEADKYLQEALMRFPSLLMEILDKCGVMPDAQVESQNKIFTRASNLKWGSINLSCNFLFDY